MSRDRGAARRTAANRGATPAPKRAAPAPPEPAAELPARHPAMLLAFALAALGVYFSVTFWITDPDVWQHLAVGREIWRSHAVPRYHVWTWPNLGTWDVTPSWLFRALLYPFWAAGGIAGLFAWRWLTSALAFFGLWAIGRRLGARGLTPLLVLVLASLASRGRTQMRPETLAALFLVAELWVLETRRRGGRDLAWLLVPLACLWINAHISYFLLFVTLAPFALGDLVARRNAKLALVGVVAFAACFLNPWGWTAVWQPFDFALHQRSELLFRSIGELMPPTLEENLYNGLPILALAWPLLALWRGRRHGWDGIELSLLAIFGALALSGTRFTGYFALVAVPYLGRDLSEWVGSRRWPRWTQPPLARVALFAATAAALCTIEWTAPDPRPGVGVWMNSYPVGACDYVAARGVKGPLYNPFFFGGYLLWRFYPDRDRLPFMDIHQSGTLESRLLYFRALGDDGAWRAMDERYRFQAALHAREQVPGDFTLDHLDADTNYALVYLDDSACLYVRHDGPNAALAADAYRIVRGGRRSLGEIAARAAADTAYRAALRADLAREAAGSRFNGIAHSLLANVALLDGRRGEARAHLEAALTANPFVPRTHQRLGDLAVEDGDAARALREYAAERYLHGEPPGLGAGVGRAYELRGDWKRARDAYRGEVRRNPDDAYAMERLRAVEAKLGE